MGWPRRARRGLRRRSRRLRGPDRSAVEPGARAESGSGENLDPGARRAVPRLRPARARPQARARRRLPGDGGVARLSQVAPAAAGGAGGRRAERRRACRGARLAPAPSGGDPARRRRAHDSPAPGLRALPPRLPRGHRGAPQEPLSPDPPRAARGLRRAAPAPSRAAAHPGRPDGVPGRGRAPAPHRHARRSRLAEPARLSAGRAERRAAATLGDRGASRRLPRAGSRRRDRAEPGGAVRADLRAAEAMSRQLGKRIVEALLFAAEEPLEPATIQAHLPGDLHAGELLDELVLDYRERGVRLERRGNRYALRTAPDLAPYLQREQVQSRRLSRAALETLAIIAYHQPVTRAEIEEMRGVSVSKGTLDLLLETGWVQPKGRRESPGRPVTWVTTSALLDHLDLSSLDDLPRIDELVQVGLLGPALSAVSAADAEDTLPVEPPADASED